MIRVRQIEDDARSGHHPDQVLALAGESGGGLEAAAVLVCLVVGDAHDPYASKIHLLEAVGSHVFRSVLQPEKQTDTRASADIVSREYLVYLFVLQCLIPECSVCRERCFVGVYERRDARDVHQRYLRPLRREYGCLAWEAYEAERVGIRNVHSPPLMWLSFPEDWAELYNIRIWRKVKILRLTSSQSKLRRRFLAAQKQSDPVQVPQQVL